MTAWGRLFLEKYDAGHAEACIDDALSVLPEDAEARTVLAAIKLEQSWDTVGALHELDRAEHTIPNYPEAEALRARIALDDEDHPRARKLANALLARNPEDIAARTVLAGAALLEDDRASFEEQRRLVLATHPHASIFFHDLGELMNRNHRYADAVPLEEEALRVDDKDAVARAAYGANLLRLNREDEGLAALRAAWRKDKYNVRTYNLLQLFEDVIPKRYTMIDAPPFRLRVPTSERALLEVTVVPFLKHAEKTLTALYGFQPKGPIQIELYTDPQHYAVRTIGLPGLDAIGVTFGQLITCMSPSLGKFNWGMVLWHELAHVYAIEASKSRVPRWFTEGLSEYETTVVDPLWTRRTSAELASALFRGELLPVEQLDRAFVHARNLSQMVVAYHESAACGVFSSSARGVPRSWSRLRSFAENKRFTDIVKGLTGQDAAAFDADCRAVAAREIEKLRRAARSAPRRLQRHRGARSAREGTSRRRSRAGPARDRQVALWPARRGQAPRRHCEAESPEASCMQPHASRSRKSTPTKRSLRCNCYAAKVVAAPTSNCSPRASPKQATISTAPGARSKPAPRKIPIAARSPRSKPSSPRESQRQPPAARTRSTADRRAHASSRSRRDEPGSVARRLFDRLVAAKSAKVPAAAKRALDITLFDRGLRVALASWLHDKGDDAGARAELARAKLCPLQGEVPVPEKELDTKIARHAKHGP